MANGDSDDRAELVFFVMVDFDLDDGRNVRLVVGVPAASADEAVLGAVLTILFRFPSAARIVSAWVVPGVN